METPEKMLTEFQKESKVVIDELLVVLDQCEGKFSAVKNLENYGQKVDRIMGGARSLAMLYGDPYKTLGPIGDFTALLKTLGYRSAQIESDEQLYHLSVALLQDATDVLISMFARILENNVKVKDVVSQTLIDRVKWLASQFGNAPKKDQDSPKLKAQRMNQGEIDELLKKLGL